MLSAVRTPILSAAVVALALGLLAGCAPATGSPLRLGSAAPNSAAPAAGGAGSGAGQTLSCSDFTTVSFSGLVNVPIGKPFVAAAGGGGSIACWWGIGKNAGVTGSKVETLSDDNILITVIGIDGPAQFAQFTGKDVNSGAVVPIDGIGDKAAYNTSALSGGFPQLYSVKGNAYCGVQIDVTASELVDPADAAVARNEGALCEDAFAHE